MFEYDFSYDKILSLDIIKKEGIPYDEEKFSFESYWEDGFNHYERLFINTNSKKEPFSGLLYELFPNGTLSGYSFYNSGTKKILKRHLL